MYNHWKINHSMYKITSPFLVARNKSQFLIIPPVNCTLLWTGRGRGRVSYQAEAPRGRFGSRSFGRGSGYDGVDRDYNKPRGNGFYRPGLRQERGGLPGHQISRSGQNPQESFNRIFEQGEWSFDKHAASHIHSCRLEIYDIDIFRSRPCLDVLQYESSHISSKGPPYTIFFVHKEIIII